MLGVGVNSLLSCSQEITKNYEISTEDGNKTKDIELVSISTILITRTYKDWCKLGKGACADCGSTFQDNKNCFETTLFFFPFLSEGLYCIRRIKKIWFGSELKWSQSVRFANMYNIVLTWMTLIENASNVSPLECTGNKFGHLYYLV